MVSDTGSGIGPSPDQLGPGYGMGLMSALADPSRASLTSDEPSISRTITVARHHRLSPLLSVLAGKALPKPLAETFRRDRVLTATRNLVLGQAAEGPATQSPSSTTLMPSSGPGMACLFF